MVEQEVFDRPAHGGPEALAAGLEHPHRVPRSIECSGDRKERRGWTSRMDLGSVSTRRVSTRSRRATDPDSGEAGDVVRTFRRP
jgi:hypothetical protein